jgi:hypothetical protein
MLAVVLLMIPITAALERRRLRRVEAAFLKGRSKMPDSEFLVRAQARPDEVPFFLAARNAMAEQCGVPADVIQPEDTVRSLLNLQWDNGYIDDFVVALEGRVRGRLPLGYPPEKTSFADYLRELHRQWVPPAKEQVSQT